MFKREEGGEALAATCARIQQYTIMFKRGGGNPFAVRLRLLCVFCNIKRGEDAHNERRGRRGRQLTGGAAPPSSTAARAPRRCSGHERVTER